jgi:predicted metal-dependent hydrolase
MIERSEIQFGTTRIAFLIHRSDRRKTVALAIDGERLIVTAPTGTTVDRLNAVVSRKALWVKQRLRTPTMLSSPPAREFVSGETFLYLGRQHRMKVVLASGQHGVKMNLGWITAAVPDVHEAEKARLVRGALVSWFRLHAEDRLPERVDVWAKKLGIQTPTVLVCEQRRRWGSCNKAGEIRLNWRIVQAPITLVDYVVAHELVHLLRGDDGHSSAFWSQLGRTLPDYDARRARLRQLGPWLEW